MKRIQTPCSICKKLIRPCNMKRHLLCHKNNPSYFLQKSHVVYHEGLNCIYCNKLFKNTFSLRQHECRCKENPNHINIKGNKNLGQFVKENGSWNKGLTKENDERVKKLGEKLKGKNSWLGKHHTEESKKKISNSMIEYNHADKKRNLHSKGGWYKGIYFMSTWELSYYIFQKDMNINIDRCKERFEYFYQNKKHYYTPDFIINECYIEIKGKEWPKDLIKYQSVRNKNKILKVIYYDEIKNYIKYVLEKYKIKEISDLYEK